MDQIAARRGAASPNVVAGFSLHYPPRGSRMCGKERVCGRAILDVWQLKGLGVHFEEVWQRKDLRESGVDSKGFRDGLWRAHLEVWMAKDLAFSQIESKGVAGAIASDNFEDLSDFPEVWQAKGLEGEEKKLGDGALTGGTGRGIIPPDISVL